MATERDIHLVRGKTFSLVIRWEQETPIVAKAITGISYANGFPRLTVVGHGLPDGWPSSVVMVDCPKQINSIKDIPGENNYRDTTVISDDVIEYNGLVPVTNGHAWAPYTKGGFVLYHTPKDLADQTIRVKFKDKIGGTVLLSTEVSDDPLDLVTAVADNATKSITIEVSAATTEALDWNRGVWEVEGASLAGRVEPIITPSQVTVGDEVVTP